MNLFGIMNVSASALAAERMRAEVTASNMANVETTRTDQGGPYRRKQVVFSEQSPLVTAIGTSQTSVGVHVSSVIEDKAAPIMRYEPSHPDADGNGFVAYPDINPVMEMTDMLGAVRAYEMNVAAVNASKQMIQQSLDILR